jgi:hypothetical protein
MSITKTDRYTGYFPRQFTSNGTVYQDLNLVNYYDVTSTRVKVNDWQKKISLGLNASGAYSLDGYFSVLEKPGLATCGGTSSTGSSSLTQIASGYINVPSSGFSHLVTSLPAANAAALSQLYRKIESETSSMNSLAALAEFGSVLNQFGKPFEAIVALHLRHLNRLKLESRGLKGPAVFRRAKWLKILASTWLETSFGLAPLISDTVSIAESVARWENEDDEVFHPRARVSGRGTQTISDYPIVSPTPAAFGFNGKFVFNGITRTTTQRKVQYICGLKALRQADFGSNRRLLQILGFTPENFVPAVHEAIPWSWLLDYFTNVGQILQASVTSTTNVTWSNKTVIQDSLREERRPLNVKQTFQALSNAGMVKNQYAEGDLGSSNVRKLTMIRTPDVDLGVPDLIFQLPTGYKRLTNMAAVLMSRRGESSSYFR